MWFQNTVSGAELLCNNFTDILLKYPDSQKLWEWLRMRMQLIPGPEV